LQKAETRFPRSARLLTPADYSRVFEQATKSTDDCFTVLCRASEKGQSRLGLAIAKKSVKRAVDRNLIKRIIRESFRHHQTELKGLDFVVMARRGLAVEDRARLRTSLDKHWARVAKRCRNT